MPGSANVPWAPILTRLPTLMPGQYGVPGTDNTTGLRLGTNGKVLYVDPNYTGVSDLRDGTLPTDPLQTIGAAIALCRDYMNDTIIVAPNAYWQHADGTTDRIIPIQESVTVDKHGVRIIGLMPSSSIGVPWVAATDDGTCITVNAMDVLIEGFCFWDNAGGDPVGITAVWDGDDEWGDNLTVRHCFFEGGLDYGITLDFSYYDNIHDNRFEECDTAAIHNLDVEGDPDYARIHNNNFYNNSVALSLDGVGGHFIYDNRIIGTAGGTDNFIALAGGSNNMVTNNWLGCTIAQYDVTCDGGGLGNAWVNNHCIDGDPVLIPLG